MTKKKQKEKMSPLDYNMPEDAKMHDNGTWYRELTVDGLADQVKIFNSMKPQRLEGETQTEYKIRRRLLKQKDNTKYLFHNSRTNGTYIKK